MRRRAASRDSGPARRRLVEGIIAATPPVAGAIVMGTGIVAVAVGANGLTWLSVVGVALAAAVWLLLMLGAILHAVYDGRGFVRLLAQPGCLTAVAGTAVLGTAISSWGSTWRTLALGLLAIAAAVWVPFVLFVVRGWQRPAVGASFVLVVSMQSLAVLASALARVDRAPWAVWLAAAVWLAGLAAYAAVALQFDLTQLRVGLGDQWVAGGALAISALAGADVVGAAQSVGEPRLWLSAGAIATFAVWVASVLWLPPLIVEEFRHPRLRYDVRRWATVFPLGMYAVCTIAVGGLSVASLRLWPLVDAGRAWSWVALAAAAAVWVGLIQHALGLGRRHG